LAALRERQGGGWAVHLGQYDRAVQCEDRGGYQGGQVVVQGKEMSSSSSLGDIAV
jgi:hypothetical protein